MTKNISDKGRKLVVIVDPHIKRDVGYFLHNDAEANGYYVKNPDGKDYEGKKFHKKKKMSVKKVISNSPP